MSNHLIEVNPQVELLMIVLLTSNYPRFSKEYMGYSVMSDEPTEYLSAIWDHFGPYSRHPIYKILDEMIPGGFFLGAPVETVLSLGPPPDLAIVNGFSEFVIKRASGLERLERFLEQLRDFAAVTSFERFFERMLHWYSGLLELFESRTNSIPYVNILEDFYGNHGNQHYLILTQLSKGSFGISSSRTDGKINIFGVYGISHEFAANSSSLDIFINNILWHEFSHPVINPLTEGHCGQVEDYEPTLDSLLKVKHPNAGYGPWDECINEHIVRAVSIFLCEKHINKALAAKMLESDLSLGYAFLPDVLERLQYYSDHRHIYPSIDKYYHKLLEVFNPSCS